MKKLNVRSTHYKEILKTYEVWLESLGYPKETKESFPLHVREFLYYLEQTGCLSVTDLQLNHRNDYEDYLKSRRNETRGGGLNSHTINKHYVAVNNFMSYLHAHNRNLQTLHFRRIEANSAPVVLTEKEVKELYEATYERERTGSYYRGQRDRAMLAVYYGCGLRLKEGTSLDLSDIDFSNQILKVRNGKKQKSREVPIAVRCLEDLKSYVEEGRDWFNYTHGTNNPNQKKEAVDKEALFLNCYGKRLSKSTVYMTLKKLRARTLIEKNFSTHSLRHSVATHLLTAGMEIETIREFLGHSTLESTQIYTHIAYGNDTV